MLQAPKPSKLRRELDRYLNTDPVDVSGALAWWHEQKNVFPHLHWMALDYCPFQVSFNFYSHHSLLTIMFSYLG